jgi:hypothetical protein
MAKFSDVGGPPSQSIDDGHGLCLGLDCRCTAQMGWVGTIDIEVDDGGRSVLELDDMEVAIR